MLKNKKVFFRSWEEQDVNKLFAWLNDEDIMLYLQNAFTPKSIDEVKDYYQKRCNEKYRYIILDINSNFQIGTCRLFNIDLINKRCEISILIGEKSYWGKGYAVEAINLCKEVAFNNLGMNRMELYCYSENLRAINLYLKCGFSIDGTLREYALLRNMYSDVYLMSILRRDFKSIENE